MKLAGALAAALVLTGCASDIAPAAYRVVASPLPTPEPTPAPTPEPTPVPTPRRTARPAPPRPTRAARPVTAAAPAGDVGAFRGLGTWVDIFDEPLNRDDPALMTAAVRDMADQGVRTLYLETSRYDKPAHVLFPRATAAALEEAHGRGIRVVAWYPPDLDDVAFDVERSLAAIRYVSPGGHRFDAFGADIEYTRSVPDHAARSANAVEYSRRLRAEAGAYPLAAIVIPPTSLQINPNRWPGFPWQALGPLYDVFMPMNYWTFRSADPATAASLTEENLRETKRLTQKPVHVIGGLADKADEPQVVEYVRASLAGGSLGGGLYDFAIHRLRPETWDELRGLNQ